MRFSDDDLLTDKQAAKLMDQIDTWCRRTGTRYNKLVYAARVAPNTRAMVRDGKRRITRKTAERLISAMRRHSNGISTRQHKENIAKPRQPHPIPIRIVVDRNPCPRCGVRGDIGCRHKRF